MALNLPLSSFLANSVLAEIKSRESILTIGRLESALSIKDINFLKKKYRVNLVKSQVYQYAEPVLKELFNCDNISSLDISNYENCSIVHDLNYEISKKYYEKFDVLIDGGCLEHIFNVPAALNNYKNLVKVGGDIFISTMANNHMGHGFYQFSPEIFFRYFSYQNGFCLKNVVLVKHRYPTTQLEHSFRYFSVTDPAKLKKRVGLVSKSPVIILIHAIKIKNETPINSFYPVQSDYQELHLNYASLHGQKKSKLISMFKFFLNKLPPLIKDYIKGNYELYSYSFRNKLFFSKWKK
jgi:hypothetical protein